VKNFKALLIFFAILLMSTFGYAGFQAYSGSTNLRIFQSIQCSTGLTCTRSGDKLLMVSSPTLSGSQTITGAEAGSGSLLLQADESDDDADDWGISALAAGTLGVQTGASGSLVTLTTWANTGDMVVGGTTPYITLGDDGAEDAGIAFDGNAQAFNISLDDSTDDLVIGLGTAAGTTDAIRIDENQVVTFVQEVLGLGTDTLSGFLRKQTASTTVALTAVQCGQTLVSNSTDVMTLPEASTVLGCEYTFVCGTDDDFDVNPADGTDVIGPVSVDGAAITPSAGDAIRCTTTGHGFTMEAVGANLWAVKAHNGEITDVN
jgi:hypothetical protein